MMANLKQSFKTLLLRMRDPHESRNSAEIELDQMRIARLEGELSEAYRQITLLTTAVNRHQDLYPQQPRRRKKKDESQTA